jgi:hypothetical protein
MDSLKINGIEIPDYHIELYEVVTDGYSKIHVPIISRKIPERAEINFELRFTDSDGILSRTLGIDVKSFQELCDFEITFYENPIKFQAHIRSWSIDYGFDPKYQKYSGRLKYTMFGVAVT